MPLCRFCEGFRMPADDSGAAHSGGRRSENLQGRKPRDGIRRWRGVGYGDLIAAADDCDLGRDEPALFSAAMRVLSQGLPAMNDEDSRTI